MKAALILVAALAMLCLGAAPAAADPVTAAIVASAGVAATSAAGVAIGIAVDLAVGIALNQLSQALLGRPGGAKNPGIRTEVTLKGATVPRSLILGRTVTAGSLVAPFYSTGEVDGEGDAPDIPNGFRYGIYNVADHPVSALRALWVDGQRFDVIAGATWGGQTISWNGQPLDADGADLDVLDGGVTIDAWAGGSVARATPKEAGFPEWHDGSEPSLLAYWRSGGQTTALPALTSRFGGHPERPWTSAMVGRGVAHAVLRCRFDPDLFQGQPQVKFETLGSRLYDPRRDSTAGGSGTQRWADPATWALTLNPIVMLYNVWRGIELEDDTRWGLRVEAADLPLATWTTAMDYCDGLVNGTPRFRAGYEVRMATAEHGGDQPFDVADELLKACAGSIADCGGTWHVRVGPAGLPVAFITDDDVVVSRPQDLEPHRGLKDVFNAVRATHPDPNQDWAAVEAPLRRNAVAEEQDGERLVADLQLPAVWDKLQVQRLQDALLRDARRMRRHTLTLPPEFSRLEPLDVISWTSARNEYTAKLWEVAEVAIEPATVALREVDPSDYDWTPDRELPTVPVSTTRVPFIAQPLPGFDADPHVYLDEAGKPRRVGARLIWRTGLTGVSNVSWEMRRFTTKEVVADGQAPGPQGYAMVRSGLLPGIFYEARATGRTPSGKAVTQPSAWVRVDVPDVRLDPDEFAGPVLAANRSVRFFSGPHNLSSARNWVLNSQSAWVTIGRVQPLRRRQGFHTRLAVVCQHGAEWSNAGRAAPRDASSQAEWSLWRSRPNGTWVLCSTASSASGAGGRPVSNLIHLRDDDTTGDGLTFRSVYELRARRSAKGRFPAMIPHVDDFVLELDHLRQGGV